MRRLGMVTVGLAVVVGVILVSCGSGESQPTPESGTPAAAEGQGGPSFPDVDPKTLVTKAELEAELGEPVDEVSWSMNSSIVAMVYSVPGGRVSVGVNRLPLSTRDVDDWKEELAPDYERVSGVGDSAYWSDPVLAVFKGRAVVVINVQLEVEAASSEVRLEKATILANKAVERLP